MTKTIGRCPNCNKELTLDEETTVGYFWCEDCDIELNIKDLIN